MRTPTIAALGMSAALAVSGAWAAGPTSTGTTTGSAAVIDAPPPDYTASMTRLQEAEQKLREAIQAAAQQPAGTQRQDAIAQAQEALFDAHRAMIALPPELRTGGEKVSAADSDKAMKRLQQAAQKFRKAVQAMADQPAGERRNKAMKEAREAILETQEAMVQLPGPYPGKQTSSGPSHGADSTRSASR